MEKSQTIFFINFTYAFISKFIFSSLNDDYNHFNKNQNYIWDCHTKMVAFSSNSKILYSFSFGYLLLFLLVVIILHIYVFLLTIWFEKKNIFENNLIDNVFTKKRMPEHNHNSFLFFSYEFPFRRFTFYFHWFCFISFV